MGNGWNWLRTIRQALGVSDLQPLVLVYSAVEFKRVLHMHTVCLQPVKQKQ